MLSQKLTVWFFLSIFMIFHVFYDVHVQMNTRKTNYAFFYSFKHEMLYFIRTSFFTSKFICHFTLRWLFFKSECAAPSWAMPLLFNLLTTLWAQSIHIHFVGIYNFGTSVFQGLVLSFPVLILSSSFSISLSLLSLSLSISLSL